MFYEDPFGEYTLAREWEESIKMFLGNLSSAVLGYSDTYYLSYKAASKACNISYSSFEDIVRMKSSSSIITLEKLCIGFQRTPNELLLISQLPIEIRYRIPMKV